MHTHINTQDCVQCAYIYCAFLFYPDKLTNYWLLFIGLQNRESLSKASSLYFINQKIGTQREPGVWNFSVSNWIAELGLKYGSTHYRIISCLPYSASHLKVSTVMSLDWGENGPYFSSLPKMMLLLGAKCCGLPKVLAGTRESMWQDAMSYLAANEHTGDLRGGEMETLTWPFHLQPHAWAIL